MAMRDELRGIYTDQDVAALFPSRGQPAAAPWRLALILVFPFAESLSDEQAMESVRGRIDWKVHVTESCDEDAPHVITHLLTSVVPGPDYPAIEPLHQALRVGSSRTKGYTRW
jgi:hypothetical protein